MKKTILEKIEKVINKLQNLDIPKFENNNQEEDKARFAKGIIARDFGISEWDWPQGVGLYGLYKFQLHKGNNCYQEFFNKWYRDNIKIGLPSRNVNTTAPLLALMDILDDSEEGFKELSTEWAKWLMDELPKTKDGGFQHVTTSITDRNGIILNEEQLWIDTIFMMVLFLNKMGIKYGKKEWIEESIHQVLVHIKYLYEKKNGLFYHGWSFIENGNFGEVFWCRGNSWFTFGIMDFLENSEGHLEDGTKKFIVNTYKSQVDALIKLQSEEGGWHTVLDDKTTYLEVSGTAGIITGIMKGIRKGILDESYKVYCERGLEFILKNISEDGTALNVSGGTGIGYNKEHYQNIVIAPMAYGQSLVLVALTEALNFIK